MKNDFKPVVGHSFNLRGDWGGVLDCEVLAVEPHKTLTYTWNFKHEEAAYNLTSVVDLDAHPDDAPGPICAWSSRASGRISQQAYGGAKHGWQKFFANLEQTLAKASEACAGQASVM